MKSLPTSLLQTEAQESLFDHLILAHKQNSKPWRTGLSGTVYR
jgi:hypothetical protein